MLETIKRCSICKKTTCSGQEYVVPYAFKGLPGGQGTVIVCRDKVKRKGDMMVYEMVVGHGTSATFVAYPVPPVMEVT